MGWLIVLFFVCLVGYCVYRFFASNFLAKSNESSESLPTINYSSGFDLDIVGESHYQANLEKLAGGRTEEYAEIEMVASIILEDTNPHDSNAVRVDIKGLTVGYFRRESALAYRRRIRELRLGDKPLACKAMIVGGWKRGDNVGHFGVKLDW